MATVTYGFCRAIRKALRHAKRAARGRGMCPGRFAKQRYATSSPLGPEWVAMDLQGHGCVTVWHPIGDMEQCIKDIMDVGREVVIIDGHVFGVRIHR